MPYMDNENGIYRANNENERVLAFSMTQGEPGAGCRHSIEIIGMQTITPIPGAPSKVRGVMNLGGKIIPIIDIRAHGGKDAMHFSDRTCTVVIEISGVSVGLLADNINDVMAMESSDINAMASFN